MKEADCYIASLDEPCTTKVNRTTINTNPPLQPSLVKTCVQGHQHTVALLFLHSVSLSLSHFVCAPVCLALLLALSIKDMQYKTNNFLLFCLFCWAAWWIYFTQNWDHNFVSRLSSIFFSFISIVNYSHKFCIHYEDKTNNYGHYWSAMWLYAKHKLKPLVCS